ncbi:PEP-CTERM sorting domain-containing protein [Tautonia plasticadhaerens]|uniref:Ice-binding protein C-terminal domain-containing protein n=1 Tax=Tautonia plasticadhaerens TaxID=2527974 RepID=A0A518GYA3_9BACT|nr:PEP-CTERM sorting domain-containing protein [Tautonia plasticadhaerens]QDV33567.1 hypothetical protein ElP_14410 [Tautonia plasticadhaerens]
MKRRRTTLSRCWSGVLLALGLATPVVRAEPIVLYETGFEASEGFAADQDLVGQGGFVSRLGLNPDAATVTTENPATGSQAVRIDGALLTDPNPIGNFAGGYYPLLNYDFVANGTPVIEISVDVLLVVLADVEQDIEAGVSAYDSQGNSYGSFVLGGPDAPAGEYGYFNIRAVYNFATGIGSFYLDDVFSFSTPFFMDETDNMTINPALSAFGEEAPPSDFVAYFDNFRVTASAVPEPSSAMLAALGGTIVAGLAMRSRRRRSALRSS